MSEFEKWAIEYDFEITLHKNSSSTYKEYDTHCAWLGWQAAKAMCEQSEPVAELQTAISGIKYITGLNNLDNLPSGTKLYTTPQPLKRLSEDEVLKLLNVKNDSPNVLVYLGISNAIMDEMERINK